MNLKRMIRNWLDSNDGNQVLHKESNRGGRALPYRDLEIKGGNPLSNNISTTFKAYPARGGLIVEISQYDRTTDHMSNQLYVIPEGSDYPAEIASIVSLEMLKY